MVKIDFELDSEFGKYRDAIVLDDGHGLSEEQIDEIKQQRLANWTAAIVAAMEAAEPPEGFEFQMDEYGSIVYDENGEPVLVPIKQGV